ncbi:HypC/HybG/HupF family hydrogenase formation chaperone [Candidatus Acetothermia bacterium]|nr:HypC/HybG/HupF family hydrogenase formation chaperone [Candidatus Acetothermia bacterium]MBI3644305.1 HypC/HybG/HupF family hydrogenase formation chaperone [Candidatus Acetothermia bacterium]
MCLAVPGRVLNLIDENPLTRRGRVDFRGIIKEVNLAFVPEAQIGNYVLVHVGFGISVIDEAEAMRVFEYLQKMGELEELRQSES